MIHCQCPISVSSIRGFHTGFYVGGGGGGGGGVKA